MIRASLVALQTILVKEILRFMRIWVQTILPPAITMALYFVIFGKLIGSQIDDVNGFTYMDYIVPGIILMSIISNSYANVVSSFFGAKYQRHVEEMLVSPVPNFVILLGFVLGGAARGIVVGFVVTAVSMFFTDLRIENPLIVLLTVLLTAVMFSIAGLINAVYARSFDDISIIPTFVLTPMTYLGGVFYSISMLSETWQNVSLINPILYMVNAMRYGMLGVSDINVLTSFALMVVFILVLGTFAMVLLKRGTGIKS